MQRVLLYILLAYGTAIQSVHAQNIPVSSGVIPAQQLLPIPQGYYNNSAKINFVRTWELNKPITDPLLVAFQPITDVKESTAYVDGQGRVIQTVSKQISPSQKDLVSFKTFDVYGRETLQYLPYPSQQGNGAFKNDPGTEQNGYFSNASLNNSQYAGEQVYYSRSALERSPLGRVDTSFAPGNSWGGAGRGVKNRQLHSTLSDSVRYWTIGDPAGSIPITNSFYGTGELYKSIIEDEHGKQIIEFKDKTGKVILKKVQILNTVASGHSGWLNTYYVYDGSGLLRVVIQPSGVEKMQNTSNWSISSHTDLWNEQCFRYEYDNRNRMIIKKVPGAGEVWMVYDQQDRLVLTQDQFLRNGGKWLYTQYDNLERPIATGLWTNSNDRSFHQNLAQASNSYPSLSGTWEELTRTYYDDYSWAGARSYDASYASFLGAGSNPYPEPVTPTVNVYGMVTGAKVKILGTTNSWIVTTSYYDAKGRVIQTLTDNQNSGVDVLTNQYDFSGKLLSSYLHHRNPLSSLTSETRVLTKMLYDHAGRIVKVWKQLNNSGVDKLVLENSYDELGQLKQKKVGIKPGSGTLPLETLNYEYNIRGWQKSINKDYVNNVSNTNFFGQTLSYDNGFLTSQYNGNISGLQWRSKGDGEQRAYGFAYDNANRLMKADFTQNNGGWNTSAGINFSTTMGDGVDPYTAYDANGNIQKMVQAGWKLGGSSTIDNLTYKYYTNSNKLKWVRDINNDINSKLGDFKEPGQNNADNQNLDLADYTYDVNGNMTVDNNKAINSIVYNHLNLPTSVPVTGKGTISYVYDAAGNKLKKTVTEGSKVTTTTYISGFVYSRTSSTGGTADTLQFAGHEEGRIRYTPPSGAVPAKYSYDYFLKDHLGNVRMVLTEETQQNVYPVASLEGLITNSMDAVFVEKDFYSINSNQIVNSTTASGIPTYQNNNGNPPFNTNPNGNPLANSAKIYRLNSTNKTGLGMTLKVMAGDTVSIFARSYFTGTVSTPSSGVSALNILDAFAGSPGMVGKGITGSSLNAIPQIASGVAGLLSSQPGQTSSHPKAFINWIIFDERFNYVSGGFDRVNPSGSIKIHNNSTIPSIVVPKSGYIFVYCSNESPTNVFFDNLQLIHSRGPILEETHYYPFGLTMAGISSKAAGITENKRKWNKGSEIQSGDFSDGSGLELYSTFYRSLDPQLGRFWQLDPRPDHSSSLYSSMGNNPISFNDPLGDTLVNKKDKIAHDEIKSKVNAKKDELQTTLNEKRNQLEEKGETLSRRETRELKRQVNDLKSRIAALQRTLYDMDAIEKDKKHGYSYSIQPAYSSPGLTLVDRKTGIIIIKTDEFLATHEIKHAAYFARGINKVISDGKAYYPANTAGIHEEINAYRAMYGMYPDRMIPRSNGRPIESIDDITEEYLKSMKDSNGKLMYPQFN